MRLRAKLQRVKIPSIPPLSPTKMVVLWVVGAAVFIAVLVFFSLDRSFPLLQTRGEVATRQRDLLFFATGLALLVLVPVYTMIFVFSWRYRAGHTRAYAPDWDSHKGYEALWWGIPIVIIGVLSVVTWVTSHSLDPFKPLASHQKPLQVQVIATQWKWLFLYPEQKIASVNEVVFPAGRPVEFTLTSDAPMNSFWVPQLAGQIYVMSGMSTKLHVAADAPGTYEGMSSNISGKGFADMRFKARAMKTRDYAQWVDHALRANDALDADSYAHLARPSTSGVRYFVLTDTELYDRVVRRYMTAPKSADQTKPTEGKDQSHMQHTTTTHDMEGM
jgi:cytochrome o ubiquinol oxidase subunit 2